MITFIIGTDTGVGKTYYGKKLINEGHKVIKPIETGYKSFENIYESDSYSYSLLQNLPIELINKYFFIEPLSPHLASEIDGKEINLTDLHSFINGHENIYVELAGGLMVPITRSYTQLDLIRDTKNANVDLVVGNKLGCINHALLTIKILRSENISINNIYINDLGLQRDKMMIDNEQVIMNYHKS